MYLIFKVYIVYNLNCHTGYKNTTKSGSCPPQMRPRTNGTCYENCTSDSQCAGNQKCCNDGCDTMCVDPVLGIFNCYIILIVVGSGR